jgi:hypothetical protein
MIWINMSPFPITKRLHATFNRGNRSTATFKYKNEQHLKLQAKLKLNQELQNHEFKDARLEFTVKVVYISKGDEAESKSQSLNNLLLVHK